MDRDQIAAALVLGERDVRQCTQKIEGLRRVIECLEDQRQPTANARELLRTYDAKLLVHIADRDGLIAKLKAATD